MPMLTPVRTQRAVEHETSLSVQRFHAMESELDRQAQKDQLRVDFTVELQEEHAEDMATLQHQIEEVEQSRYLLSS